jgi:hypothetical protein
MTQTTRLDQQLARDGQRIRQSFGASLMSDTKWRKLFAALDRPNLEISQSIVKFIDADNERRIRTPTSNSLHPPKPFFDTIEFGPISFRSIEWIEFPSVAEYPQRSPNDTGRISAKRVTQDLAKVEAILDRLGKFPITRTERGLRISGYVRPPSSS